MWWGCRLLLVFLAAAQGWKMDGEYHYQVSVRMGAGTMDHAPHMTGAGYGFPMRVQKSGNKMAFEMMKPDFSEYVGPMGPMNEPEVGDLNFMKVPNAPDKMLFGVNLGDDGLVKSVAMPGDLAVHASNILKGWASIFQINLGEINKGHYSFRSKEQTLHGDCNVAYTVTSGSVFKSVDHVRDCKDRSVRIIDDWRGHFCDMKQQRGLESRTNTEYTYEKDGDNFKVTGIFVHGALISQMYETDGGSHMVVTNITMTLKDVKSSSGDIDGGSTLFNSLKYEFDDKGFQWKEDRDLKAAEPLFSSAKVMEADQGGIKKYLEDYLDAQTDLLHTLGNKPEDLEKHHKKGIAQFQSTIVMADYNTLKAMGEVLKKDKSENGVTKWRIFVESVGAAGSSASAMLVKDYLHLIENGRDAGRIVSSVPFHIRRPNEQLVNEYAKLLQKDGPHQIANMAVPLAFGHLVRRTCALAGKRPDGSPESYECFKTLGAKWVQHFFDKFQSTSDRKEKLEALAVMYNIRYGGVFKKLAPVIMGKTGDANDVRVSALWASTYEMIVTGKAVDFLMPIYADRNMPCELRIAAVTVMSYSKLKPTDYARIMTVMLREEDYELINMVFATLKKLATSIDPCDAKRNEYAAYFLKYMKQFSEYETNWNFGVSKTYQRQFHKKKYGYGGAYTFYTIGSENSMTPLSIGMSMDQSLFNNYHSHMFGVHIRIEGLAKHIIHKFKTMDAKVWKTEDLKDILKNQMGIRAIPDQPVRVQVIVMLKGTIVVQRAYDDSNFSGAKVDASGLLEMMSKGTKQAINYLRAIQFGSFLYEQPNEIGLPLMYFDMATLMFHTKATFKQSQTRGMMVQDVEYELCAASQGRAAVMLMNPASQKYYGIVQSRIYKIHAQRRIQLGFAPLRYNAKFSFTNPSYDKPWQFVMHAQNTVFTFTPNKDYPPIESFCPSCKRKAVVSNKDPQRRVAIDNESVESGARMNWEYFDCELDVDRKNTLGKTLGVFMSYNKNPKTLYTSVVMGLDQMRTFFMLFPRVEKCGIMIQMSQSKNNPVKTTEISLKMPVKENNGRKLYFTGKKVQFLVSIERKGTPDRKSGMKVGMEFSPGMLSIKFTVQYKREAVPEIAMKPYVFCMAYGAKYPSFSDETMGVDLNSDLSMTGKLLLQHGVATDCKNGEGEIKMEMEHSTTKEAREQLKDKWYYKDCMKHKNSPDWKGRPATAMPMVESCYWTAFDATNARKYKYNIEFVKLTDKTKMFFNQVRAMVEVGLLPYWDGNPEVLELSQDIGPFLNVEATMKNNDKQCDATFETRYGTKTVKDYNLKLPWGNRLTNLKFGSTPARLMKAGIISPCVFTSEHVRTNDNMTYASNVGDCWTLLSGHCGEHPSYAVFAKKSGGHCPMVMKAFFGGHEVMIDADAGSVTIDGGAVALKEKVEHVHKVMGTDVVKVLKWGSTFHLYNGLYQWIHFDGHYVSVIPPPSVKGVHCGMCGNYNRNKFDEWTGKDHVTKLKSAQAMVEEWKWKC